ncbi:MAG TPA: hypothetical protein VK727_09590 [Steroidobacteraceae bacterium]|jgi:hypothetical protein|nr:hypothetical protein [Steroidobacteraceae bacterium]
MYKMLWQRSLVLAIAVVWATASLSLAQAQPAAIDPPPSTAADGLQIVALAESANSDSIIGKASHVRLNDKLWVVLNRPLPDAATKYTLFLNDEEVGGLSPPIATTSRSQPALLFTLKRTSLNDAFWRELLGSPVDDHVNVVVSLGRHAGAGPSERIAGAAAGANFELEVFTGLDLALAVGVILLVLILVWGHARTRTTLRDNLLPQLAPSRQPYSLGRSQMAFWFTLIFVSFVVLFFLLQDTNILTSQALLLMGISGCTAAAAVAVDVARTSPADVANCALQALGLKTYEDVQRVQQEIVNRATALAALPPASPQRPQLQIEINDRTSILRTYEDKVRPFVSQGWFKDVTTDINGPTVHRLQVVFWTAALGAIFLYSVYRNLAMPEFNGTLLALMGISSAGYVGFKIQEVNN